MSDTASLNDTSRDLESELENLTRDINTTADLSMTKDMNTTTDLSTTDLTQNLDTVINADISTCICGEAMDNEENSLCENCQREADELTIDTDVVTATSTTFDQSATTDWTNDHNDTCMCTTDQTCYTCSMVDPTTDQSTIFDATDRSMAIQTLDKSVQFDNSKDLPKQIVSDLDRSSSHYCESNVCDCDEIETINPCDKNTQVTDLMLMTITEEDEEDEIVPLDVSVDHSESIDSMLEELMSEPPVEKCLVCEQEVTKLPSGVKKCQCNEDLLSGSSDKSNKDPILDKSIRSSSEKRPEKELDILQHKSDTRNSVPKVNQDDSKTLSSDDPETSSHYTEQETRPSDVSRPMKRRSPIGAHEDQVNY